MNRKLIFLNVVLALVVGYAGYLIRPDGSEADTGGIDFVQ